MMGMHLLDSSQQQTPWKRPLANRMSRTEASKIRILIVEDELIVAENLKEILEEEGFRIVGIVDSGEDAVQKFNDLKPNLLLMDIQLAGQLDGIETIIEIDSKYGQVPVLFVSAYRRDLFPHLARLSPEQYGYISKPATSDELVTAITKLGTSAA